MTALAAPPTSYIVVSFSRVLSWHLQLLLLLLMVSAINHPEYNCMFVVSIAILTVAPNIIVTTTPSIIAREYLHPGDCSSIMASSCHHFC
mmetsp:Transcript_33617/g.57136  ORF Transcript_33617/g.57136 Transcript_33617/m.57136 type:complete len:90 (-) Transcript_33617:455-724(-)